MTVNSIIKHIARNLSTSALKSCGLSGMLILFSLGMFAQQQVPRQDLNPCQQKKPVVYSVDVNENNGNGSDNSIYNWSVLEPQFSGEIFVLTSSGNKIEIEWQDSPSGIYTLKVLEKNLLTGCTGDPRFLEVSLDVGPQFDPIQGPDMLCEGETALYSHTQLNGTWTIIKQGGNASIDDQGLLTAEEGKITLLYNFNIGICEYSVEKTIFINPLPVVSLEDASLCIDEKTGEVNSPATLFAQTDDGNYSFTWYKEGEVLTVTNQPELSVLKTGNYSVQVKNIDTGCTSELINAEVIEAAIPTKATASVSLDFDDRQTVKVDVFGSGNYQYSFNGGPFQSSNIFNDIDALPGTYPIEIISEGGCKSLVIEVTIINYPKFLHLIKMDIMILGISQVFVQIEVR
ncbi:hypothetical protein ACFSO9_14690 [Mesonia maritima]|uniref:hypothetical protein n=1 Tax=Mesonia maritima TaxID=1793873 RepID=UPI0036348385